MSTAGDSSFLVLCFLALQAHRSVAFSLTFRNPNLHSIASTGLQVWGPLTQRTYVSLHSSVDQDRGESYETSLAAEKSIPNTKQNQKQRWITCSSTKELANAIQKLVKPGDNVAELGSQLREVSISICEAIQGTNDDNNENMGKAILVDTVRKFPKDNSATTRTKAMRRAGDEVNFYPQCAQFCEIAQLDDWRQAFFFGEKDDNPRYFDVLVLDVSSIVGNDLEWTTLSIIREFLAINPCHLVLVKSVSLNQWASRLVHGRKWCRQGGVPVLFGEHGGHNQKHSNNNGNLCHVVATVGVHEYRETILHTVEPGDAVLEIGCHLGTSTALIDAAAKENNKAGYCIGVDIGSKIIRGAQQRYPELFFEIGDAWRTASLLRIQNDFKESLNEASLETVNKRMGYDVVYVDVGGLSGQDGVIEALSLISALANALEPRTIVIKSQCVRRISSLIAPYWHLQKMSIL